MRSVTATVDYLIDPEVASLDQLLWFRNTAHSKLLAATWHRSATHEVELFTAESCIHPKQINMGPFTRNDPSWKHSVHELCWWVKYCHPSGSGSWWLRLIVYYQNHIKTGPWHSKPPTLSPKRVGSIGSQETPASLSQTLETALAAAGANVSINVLEIGYPIVSIKITSTTTSTAASCPGNPVCGGLVGQCVMENDANESTLRCQCSETYAGEACDLRVCPMCENNGTCKSGAQDPTSKWTCACPEGYQGISAFDSSRFSWTFFSYSRGIASWRLGGPR